jgi:hypothetical protein
VSVSVTRNGMTWQFESQPDADAWLVQMYPQGEPAETWQEKYAREPHHHVSGWACAVGDHLACNPGSERVPFTRQSRRKLLCPPCYAAGSWPTFEGTYCACGCHS